MVVARQVEGLKTRKDGWMSDVRVFRGFGGRNERRRDGCDFVLSGKVRLIG